MKIIIIATILINIIIMICAGLLAYISLIVLNNII